MTGALRLPGALARRVFPWLDVVAFAVLWVLAFRYGARTWLRPLGLVLALGGLALWLVARRQLGDAFTIRAEARRLVRSGLYARVRHPIYVFGGLAYLGALLALQWWTLLAGWLALETVVQTVRVRQEERALEARFGDDYRLYRSRTWF